MYEPDLNAIGAGAETGTTTRKEKAVGTKRLARICALLAGFSVVAAGLCIYSLYLMTQNMGVLEQETANVVVARTELAPGKVVETGDVEVRAMPASAVPDGALEKAEDAVGKTANATIAANAVVSGKNLSGEGAETLAGRLGKGKVAATVAVTAESGNAGLIHQGDNVTIIGQSGSKGDKTASSVVEHAKVVAVGSSLDVHDKDYTTVTVEATPGQAEKIATAQAAGSVTCAVEASGK